METRDGKDRKNGGHALSASRRFNNTTRRDVSRHPVQKINYQRKLDELVASFNGRVHSLVLHSCCAPCSSYCVEYLSSYFKIMVLFYNPNIYPREEYFRRVEEQKNFIRKMDAPNGLEFIEGDYDTAVFYQKAGIRAFQHEGDTGCAECYRFRLERAAQLSKELGYDYFATTLSISPHKNSQVINKVGEEVAQSLGANHLPSDFKKKNGFKRSIELSGALGLYRQDYCGCVYSKKERDERFDKIEEAAKQDEHARIVVTGCCDDCRHRSVQIVRDLPVMK